MIQADPAVVHELSRLVTTETIIAVALGAIGLSALGVAIAAVLAIRKLTAVIDHTVLQIPPKLEPLLGSATRIAANAEDVAATMKVRMNDVLDTVEQMSGKLKSGVQAVEDRVKQFGTVVDVVQSEAEELLLDAASTARGVHTAAGLLRGRRAELEPEDEYEDVEEDIEEDEEEFTA